MKPLTKPREGFNFWIWNLLFHFNFARTGTWGEDVNGKRVTYFLGLHTVETEDPNLYAISFIFFPVKIMVGWGLDD
jgi:hypothetical protein